MTLDSRTLRSFIALAEDLHFGRTADRLNIAQSVLSAQLKRIEDRIGTRLLDRGRRTAVSLTRAGETFLVEARAAIAQLDRAERIGLLAGRGEAGSLHIGYIFSAAMCGLLPRGLGTIRRSFPELEVHAAPMDTPEQIAAIADHRLDIGFIRPREIYPGGIVAHVVHSEALILVHAAGHPLEDKSEICARDLAGETFIVPQFNEKAGFAKPLRDLADRGGFSPGPYLGTGDFVTAISMVAGGYGVLLAPRSLMSMGVEGIRSRSIVDYDGRIELAIACRENDRPLVLDTLLANL